MAGWLKRILGIVWLVVASNSFACFDIIVDAGYDYDEPCYVVYCDDYELDLIDTVDNLLHEIACIAPVSFDAFAYDYPAKVGQLGTQLYAISKKWHHFIFDYLHDYEVPLSAFEDIVAILADIRNELTVFNPYMYNYYPPLQLLATILSDINHTMDKPWLGWSATTLDRFVGYLDEARYTIKHFETIR